MIGRTNKKDKLIVNDDIINNKILDETKLDNLINSLTEEINKLTNRRDELIKIKGMLIDTKTVNDSKSTVLDNIENIQSNQNENSLDNTKKEEVVIQPSKCIYIKIDPLRMLDPLYSPNISNDGRLVININSIPVDQIKYDTKNTNIISVKLLCKKNGIIPEILTVNLEPVGDDYNGKIVSVAKK